MEEIKESNAVCKVLQIEDTRNIERSKYWGLVVGKMYRMVKNKLCLVMLHLVVNVNCEVYQKTVKFEDGCWDEDLVVIVTVVENRRRQRRAVE